MDVAYELQEQLRSTDAHSQLVQMLQQDPHSELAHRILLVFQNLADKEADRKLLISCDCAAALKPFLISTFSPEVLTSALTDPHQSLTALQCFSITWPEAEFKLPRNP